jgi:RimJ/RimL family protein N-acetyltransferase
MIRKDAPVLVKNQLESAKAMEKLSINLVPYDVRFLDLSWFWLNEPEIKALTMTSDFSREQQRDFYSSLTSRSGYHIWGIELIGHGPIGATGLKNPRGLLVEYWGYIGEKEWWGKGIGKKVIGAVEEQALQLGYRSLDLKVSMMNDRAIGLYLKLGFVARVSDEETGVLRMVKSII